MITVQDRIKKQKEEAEKRKQAQADAGSAPITPLGVSGLGSTPDQAKMAGTPATQSAAQMGTPAAQPPSEGDTLAQAAMQQEQAAAVPQDATLQTELGEKSFEDQQRDKAQERAAQFSQKMETFGSLGNRVETMVSGAFSGVTGEGELKNLAADVGFEIGDVQGLMADGTDEASMKKLLSDFSAVGQDDATAAFQLLVDNQSMFKNPSSGIMSFVDKAYKKDSATMHQTVANLVANDIVDPDQVNFKHLISSGFIGTVDAQGNKVVPTEDANGNPVFPEGTIIDELQLTTDELQQILGDDWVNLTPEQIGEEVEKTRDAVLANRERIEAQLADPNLPPQTRASLLDELQRMGATGMIQVEAEAVEAQRRAADSGKIMIGGEVQDVANLLQDEEIKDSVVDYLYDPDSPENQEWAKMNPEFAAWVSRELDSLNVTKDVLEQNLSNFEGIQKSNENFVTSNLSDKGGILDPDIMKALGYGDQAFEVTEYGADDDPVYNMLSNLANKKQTAEAVGILNDLPPSQVAQLKGLPPEKLKELLTNPDKMNEFATMAKMKEEWANISNSNDVDKMANLFLGGGDVNRALTGADAVKARMSELYAKMQFGGSPEVQRQYELMKTVFDQNGDGHIDDPDKVKAAIDNLLQKEGDISTMVDTGLEGLISSFRNMGNAGPVDDPLYIELSHGGAFGAGDTTIHDHDIDKLVAKGVDIGTLEQLLDPKMSKFNVNNGKVLTAMKAKANDTVNEKLAQVKNSGLVFSPEFDASSSAENRADIDIFKSTVNQLEDIIANGHPMEREAAQTKLNEMRKKTTVPKQGTLWSDITHASKMMFNAPPLTEVAPEHQKYFNRLPDGRYRMKYVYEMPDEDKAIVYRWATWQNFAKDRNDLNAFLNDLS
jgi:hypothetical protein